MGEAIGDRAGRISVRTGAMEAAQSYLEKCHVDEGISAGPYVFLEVSDGTKWQTEWSRSGHQGNDWVPASVDLSKYAGSTIKVRFRSVTGTSYQSDMAIDDIRVVGRP